jgi:tripartite-type tricarboxylate transporter receptor subunit TctC
MPGSERKHARQSRVQYEPFTSTEREPMKTMHLLFVSICLAVAQAAQAQATYPRKQIRMIVPNIPGGAFDATARHFALGIGRALGQTVVIENIPAALGVAGLQAAARSAPDGYTILFTSGSNISFLPLLRKNLPYDVQKDFAPIARIGFLDSFIVVHPSVKVQTFKELLDLANAKPESVTWASWGPTSVSNLYIEWLKHKKNIVFLNVPYKTSPQANNAVVAGESQVVAMGQGSAASLIKAGRLRPLAFTGVKRSPLIPEIPTVKETGIGLDDEMPLWSGLFAPAGTPREIIDTLNKVVNALLADRATEKDMTARLGFVLADPNTPEQFTAEIQRDRATYMSLIKLTGIRDE